MGLSVIKYPQGRVINVPFDSSAVASNSAGTALFTSAGHGMSTGDYVYILSNLTSYNGFWYVNKVSNDTFKIREYPTATDQAYVNTGTVSYRRNIVTHGWNSVHLPIVYKLKSTLWPTNSADTARTISTFTNRNGYTYITASGDIKATGTASSLEKVILAGTSVDGVYNIIEWLSDTNFVIDLPYSAANVLSSGTVQYYYFNYHARIKVYAGLDSGHFWAGSKPYVLVTEQRCYPDTNGIITLNVADFVKQQIQVLTNNLRLDQLPNDIDSFCRIKISYAESYDDSDMYTISEHVGSYTDDTTEIYAINAKPQFKTRGSGSMNYWVSGFTSDTLQKWLTPFTRPTYFVNPNAGYVDKYFDVSYINNIAAGGNYIKQDIYSATGHLLNSSIQLQTDNDQGVYRFAPVGVESYPTATRVDLTLYNSAAGGIQLSETITIDVVTSGDCFDTSALYVTWKNYLGGHDYWAFKAQKLYSVDVEESKTTEVNIYENFPESYGETGDTIRKQTIRASRNVIQVSSQFLTKAQADALALIISSPLVQILTTSSEEELTVRLQRTVIVSPNTLRKYKDRQNMYTVTFQISYTDPIGVQSL